MPDDEQMLKPEVTDAMIEAGRKAMISDEWSSMVDLNRLPQAYRAMHRARPSTISEDDVEAVARAIFAEQARTGIGSLNFDSAMWREQELARAQARAAIAALRKP